MSHRFGSIDELGEGYGFRKVRRELGVTAFGVNVIVYPPGYDGFAHSHDVQDELYFVHRGPAGSATWSRRPRARCPMPARTTSCCSWSAARAGTWSGTATSSTTPTGSDGGRSGRATPSPETRQPNDSPYLMRPVEICSKVSRASLRT
jgi:hypothetical protein